MMCKRDNGTMMRAAAVALLSVGLCIPTLNAQPQQTGGGSGGSATGAGTEAADLSSMAQKIEIMRVVLTNAINDGAFGERYRTDVEAAKKAARKKLVEELSKADDDESEATAERTEPAVAPPVPPAPLPPLRSDGDGYLSVAYGGELAYVGSRSATFTSYTRGFYADGSGVLFTTEVRTPIRQVETERQAERPERETGDEWARARDEALGGDRTPGISSGGGSFWVNRGRDDRAAWTIDEQYVELAVQGVIEAVARHGLRLDGLGDDESIIVAMRFSPDRFGFMTMADDPEQDTVAASVLSRVGRHSGRAADLNVVIEVPKSLLRAFDAERISLDELRRQSTITTYSKAGASEAFKLWSTTR